MSNLFSLPGVEGQEQSVRSLLRRKREDPGMDGGGGGESGEEKETRSVIGGDRGEGHFVTMDYQTEGLSEESEAPDAPSASSGHT
ncbi:hypothetical protein NDU88_006179 [Pleurodeles waltl]|uniref:Uncharacterized protein n=1 Tax=Pleurodeles waltl TaxID=8319 RepID=A0AAV7RKV5_PLEWA|nr:hypothetical protein NDU88_006179 [Pleurodeles waltl]